MHSVTSDYLRRVTPEAMEKALEAAGWKISYSAPNRMNIWRKRQWEAHVPLDMAFSDYGGRVYDVIESINKGYDILSFVQTLLTLLPEEDRREVINLLIGEKP